MQFVNIISKLFLSYFATFKTMVRISHFIHFKVLFTFVQFQNVLLHWFLKLQVNFSEVLKDYRRRYIIHVLVIVIDLHFTGFIIKKYIKLKQLIMTHWKKSAKKKSYEELQWLKRHSFRAFQIFLLLKIEIFKFLKQQKNLLVQKFNVNI